MPFPPTPSNTPSNTPTPSITASVTPTQTPTGTVCPGLTPTATSTIPVTPTNTQTNTATQTPTSTIGSTPTQTPSYTPTPTATLECLCFSSATVNVTEGGNITFNDCNGNPTIESFSVGDGQTYGDGTFCIQKDTNGGTASYTIVSYNDCCTPPPPTSTPTNTNTPTATISLYIYLGRTAVDAGNSADACNSYLTVRPYYILKSSLASITVGDRFYDSYPSTPTNGGNNWIALKSSGVGTAYSFQIDTSGYVIQTGGAC